MISAEGCHEHDKAKREVLFLRKLASCFVLHDARIRYIRTEITHATFLRLPYHLIVYTEPRSTGTSTSGPTAAANPWSLWTPNVITATVITNQKLLIAAVKLGVNANLYQSPSFVVTHIVARKR
jgi:hypothetical protein